MARKLKKTPPGRVKQITEYVIGYGKPPKHTQFKKGVSGNDKGRTKDSESKNIARIFTTAMNKKITIIENGKRIRVTKQNALIVQAINKALGGDARSSKTVFEMFRDFGFFDIPAVQKVLNVRAVIPPPPHLRTPEQQRRY